MITTVLFNPSPVRRSKPFPFIKPVSANHIFRPAAFAQRTEKARSLSSACGYHTSSTEPGSCTKILHMYSQRCFCIGAFALLHWDSFLCWLFLFVVRVRI